MSKVHNYVRGGNGKLILGILFTVIGAGLLVERVTGSDVWDYLWKLWPLLLIIWGVKILLDYNAIKKMEGREA